MKNNLKIGLIGLAAKPIPMIEGNICAPNLIVFNLAKELEKKGCDVKVFTGNDSDKDLSIVSANLHSIWKEYGNDKVDPVGYTWRRIEFDQILSNEAISLYKNGEIDIINSHDFRTSPYLFSRSNIPVIYTVHGEMKNHNNDYDKYRYNMIKKSKIGFSNMSRQNEQFCKENGLKSYGFTPNGINIEKFSYSENKREGVLFVARMIKAKMVEEAIKAALEANMKITLIGPEGNSKSDKDYFRSIKEKYFNNDKVEYLGPKKQDELVEYYQKSEVLLYPSTGEGMPLTVLEAMSCGLPVIASKVGGIPDIIDDGEEGFLLEDFSPDKVSAKIKEIPSILNKRCREKIENEFSYSKMADHYLEAYNKFMEEDPNG